MVTAHRRRVIVRALAATICLLAAAGFLTAWTVAGDLVAPEPCLVGEPPSDLPATSITLESQSGATLAGWHLRARSPRGVVVLLHGIRGSRLNMIARARMFFHAAYSVVMIDLQAHGESDGKRITIGYLEKFDARAAVAFAKRQHPGMPICVVGLSLGGAAALLGGPMDIDALVLESVYPRIENAVRNRVEAKLGNFSAIPTAMLLAQLKPRWGISASDLRPIENFADVECPVFIASGTEDLDTTAAETKQMYTAALDPKELWMVEGAGHEDLFNAAPAEYRQRVLGFVNEHLHQSEFTQTQRPLDR